MGMNNFGKRNFMQPMGRLSMPSWIIKFSLSEGVGLEETGIFCFLPCSQCAPIMFSSSSQCVPKMFPNAFPIVPRFYPI